MIAEDKWFYFAGGNKARSIEELKQALESMDEQEFRHHVNNERNDFASWVEGVFKESRLASDMREVSEKEGMQIILDDHLKNKSAKPAHHAAKKERSKQIIPGHEKKSSELSEGRLKSLVKEARQELSQAEKEAQSVHKATGHHHPAHAAESSSQSKEHHHKRYVIKEFIYGFVLGLIFGLIMLGIIFNLPA